MSDQPPEKKPSHYPRSCVRTHYQAEDNKPTRQTVEHSVVGGEVDRERERTPTQMISIKHPMKIPPILYISNDQNIVILM